MNEYKMRRSDREADADKACAVLYKAEFGVLSTAGSDGYPYGIPVNFVYDGEKVYFHCAINAGHKQVNLTFNNKISFAVVENAQVIKSKLTTRYRSVILFGTAEKTEINKRYALELLAKKYAPDFSDTAKSEIEKFYDVTDVYEITIEKISAKANI